MYQQYDQAVQIVLEWMVRLGFSRSPRMAFREATRAFKTYLVGLNIEYSQAHAQRWLIGTQPHIQRKKFLARRRALALVDQVLTHETIKQTRFYYADRRTRYTIVFGTILNHIFPADVKTVVNHPHLRWTEMPALGFSFFCMPTGLPIWRR